MIARAARRGNPTPPPEPALPESVEAVGRQPVLEAFADLWLELYFEQPYAAVARQLDRLRALGFEVRPTAETYFSGGRTS